MTCACGLFSIRGGFRFRLSLVSVFFSLGGADHTH